MTTDTDRFTDAELLATGTAVLRELYERYGNPEGLSETDASAAIDRTCDAWDEFASFVTPEPQEN